MKIAKIVLIVLIGFFDAVFVQAGERSRIEQSFRDTPLSRYENQVDIDLTSTHPIPKSIDDAGRLILETIPKPVSDDLLTASNRASKDINGCRCQLPPRAQAIAFADSFWQEANQGKLRKELPVGASLSDTRIIFSGFYESLLNRFAIAWQMRALNGEGRVLRECKSNGIEDVNACLKIALLRGLTVKSGDPIATRDLAYVYLPQPELSE